MMNKAITIQLKNSGKRFNKDWIFKNLSYQFQANKFYAITGPNGSGKSTLLQSIFSSIQLSEGNLVWLDSNVNKEIENEKIHRYASIAAPYLELIEEMTALEFLHFHQTFKPFISTISLPEIIAIVGLEKSAHKQIRYYSSGMKQRLKLAQAFFSNTPVLLLDEPTTNLDSLGIALYHSLIQNHCLNKIVIVCSNDESEMDFCTERLNILDYK